MTKAKWTPEQRAEIAARRGRELAEYRRIHPESDEQKQRRKDGMRAYWASLTPEQAQHLKDKLRAGVKLAYQNDPAYRNKIAEATRRQHAEGRANPGEMTEERRRKISEAQKGYRQPHLTDEVCSAAGKKAHELHRDDPNYLKPLMAAKDKAIAGSIAEMKTNPRRGRFETNIHGREWHVRDPRGIPYHFVNLRHFIRNNQHLFTPEQLRHTNSKDKERTLIDGGFQSLRPTKRRPSGSWYGWTWIHSERPPVDPIDPLSRNTKELP